MRDVVVAISILLIVAFIISILLIFATAKQTGQILSVEKQSIENAIIEDASQRFRGADIIDIVKLTKKDNNEVAVLRVTYNYSSICPKREHVYYSYPEGRFLPQYPIEVITSCDLCRNSNNCLIAYEEEAIIASTNIKGTEKLRDFVINEGASPIPKKIGENVWKVTWISEDGKIGTASFTNKGELIQVSVSS
ncbi:MAG: hypothetical protein QXS91_01385 [Candidatus Anstonellales archaeon]